MDRDLNAALNLADMACRHAQAEGINSHVARTGRFTPTARRGPVSLVSLDQHSPLKREASSDASQRGNAPALAG
jgi:transposase